MAKYGVTYACGHDGEVVLFGPNKDRESKLKWYAEYGTCPKCVAAHGAIHELKFVEVSMSYDEYKARYKGCHYEYNGKDEPCIVHVPDESQNDPYFSGLYGSAKQIGWAAQLRETVATVLEYMIENSKEYVVDEASAAILEKWQQRVETLQNWHNAGDIITAFKGIIPLNSFELDDRNTLLKKTTSVVYVYTSDRLDLTDEQKKMLCK